MSSASLLKRGSARMPAVAGTNSIIVLRQRCSGAASSPAVIAPTGLEIGKDGAFYVTNFGASAGNGQVLRIAAVPEPGTWAMMIAGFGLVGAAMRRRQRFTLRYLQRSPS